jgi:hypothetical protein
VKTAARDGNADHAPASSRLALISAYTGGADVLWFCAIPTKGGHWVLARDDDVSGATGAAVRISELTMHELRQLDFSETFKPRNSDDFHFYDPERPARRLRILALDDAFEELPGDAVWVLELRGGDHPAFQALGHLIGARGLARNIVVFTDDDAVFAAVATTAVGVGRAMSGAAWGAGRACDVVVSAIGDVVTNQVLSPLGTRLARSHAEGAILSGVMLDGGSKSLDAVTRQWLEAQPWVWALASTSTFEGTRNSYIHTQDSFKTNEIDRTRFAFGYARANKYGAVYADGSGVNLKIAAYGGDYPAPPSGSVESRLDQLQWRMTFAEMNSPFYSGGGVGVLRGLRGDFAAEVTYTADTVAQATTLEMAVVNIDPGAHRADPPASFRDKDSFYDPHGAPPFVGVEHDEDDGYRINWNFGTQYDNNQYGPPVGDGRSPRGARLRLERRGAYFAAYYRDPHSKDGSPLAPRDWVCVGVVRNESMNSTVFLRCAGKRWRQEKADDPSQYEPIVANHFVFTDLRIECFPTGV